MDPETGQLILHEGVYEDCNAFFEADEDIFSVTAEPGAELVGDCSYMFADCSNLKSVDLTEADMSGATCMNNMFSNCVLCESIDISGADTSSVTDMSSMFSGCGSLTNLNIDNIDTTAVTKMNSMFYGCISLTDFFMTVWTHKTLRICRKCFGNAER